MPVPDHQSATVTTVNASVSRRPSAIPVITREFAPGTLDIDQLAAVLARLLEL
jgi:hypothetical protein